MIRVALRVSEAETANGVFDVELAVPNLYVAADLIRATGNILGEHAEAEESARSVGPGQ